jgi:hypothetical protein
LELKRVHKHFPSIFFSQNKIEIQKLITELFNGPAHSATTAHGRFLPERRAGKTRGGPACQFGPRPLAQQTGGLERGERPRGCDVAAAEMSAGG